jgi:hypothetical protein
MRRARFSPASTNGRTTMPTLIVNGQRHNVDVEADTPLLWVLRDTLGLTGTKYGCGIAQCGACTVHIDGAAVRSCSVQYGDVANKEITTIEGLAAGGVLHKVQRAWLERAAVRLLPVRHDHGGGRSPQQQAEADRRRHRRGHHQYLSLRHLPAGACGNPRRRQCVRRWS